MTTVRTVRIAALVVLFVGGPAGVAAAGDLNPPAGAINPTMKDLDDVEPRGVIRNSADGLTPIVISQRGSYKLGENIQALGGEHGIEITASGVTLDLNGFEIVGSEVGSLSGVRVDSSASDVTIRNGRIRLFTGSGIGAADSAGCRIEGVDVRDTQSGGIVCGDDAFVDRCTVESVTVAFAVGISVGENSKVMDCSVDECYTGFLAEGGSQVRGCRASSSTFAGYYLLGVADIRGCAAIGANSATQYGVYQEGSGGGEIADNMIRMFGVAGIRGESRLQIHDNVLLGADVGGDLGLIITGPRNFIFRNSIADCSSGMDLSNVCEQEVYANRLSNTGALAINSCTSLAPEEQAHTSTNPHANLR